jgi:hypothetical protein
MEEVRKKTCSVCGVDKDLSEFYDQTGGLYGKKSQCTLCYNEMRKNRPAELITTDMVRVCKVCGETKPLLDFKRGPSCKYGRTYTCKACEAKRVKEHYVDKPAKKNEQRRLDYRKHREKRLKSVREWNLKTKYGLTISGYECLWEQQHGLCAVCGLPLVEGGGDNKWPPVDHDHVTNKIRGIVHDLCNRMVGIVEKYVSGGHGENLGQMVDQYLKNAKP